MRFSSWALLVGAAGAGALYESIFLGSAPFPLAVIKPIFTIVVILLILNRSNAAYVVAGVAGVLVDIKSPLPTGFAGVRWLLVVICLDAILERTMTNRSLYSAVLLVLCARCLDRILLTIISWFSGAFLNAPIAMDTWKTFFLTVGSDMVITALCFLGIFLFTRRFMTTVSGVSSFRV